MFGKARYWRQRALLAEAEIKVKNAALQIAEDHLDGVELRLADQAKLISIVTEGNTARFLFVRNGKLIPVETYLSMSMPISDLKRDLLERGNDGD